jgi:3-hydroxyacyl-CoA dehydrogenase
VAKDRVGQFLWKTISKTLTYTADRIPEIADTVVEVDRAMRWGFNWELGPFEVWDAIGVEKSAAKLKEEGRSVPANVQKLLDSGAKTFYKQENGQRFYFDFASSKYVPLADPPGTIILKSLKDRTGVIKANSGASMIDLGDGVACVEFHSKMNSIGGDTLEMLRFAIAETEKNFVGLVVGNQGVNFSVGANLMLMLMEAQDENWEELEMIGRYFQSSVMSLRYSPKPVVVRAVSNGFSAAGAKWSCTPIACAPPPRPISAWSKSASALYPPVAAPKEMLVARDGFNSRRHEGRDPFPFVKRAFETIALAKVATSAEQRDDLGFLLEQDSISMNGDRLIADAKKQVLALAATGYVQPQQRTDILALGAAGRSRR